MMRALFLLTLVLVTTSSVLAHPLGNNTLNRQSAIVVRPREVTVEYRLDLAEIPTLAEGIAADADGDGQTSETEWDRWAQTRTEEIRQQLQLQIGEQLIQWQVGKPAWHLAPGEAGLSILALRLHYSSPLVAPKAQTQLRFRDSYNTGASGWKEIWIAGTDGVSVVSSNVPDRDRSRGLTEFGLPLGVGAPQELSAMAELSFPGEIGQGMLRPLPLVHSESRVSGPSDSNSSTVYTSLGNEAWAFFKLGIHHIAVGYDHLAFLLGLLLLSPRLGQMVKVITAFTLAHSATLGLAANGWIAAPGAVVEPAIALTIVYVGALGTWSWRRNHGVWLAFGFGLVHGLGFAGALSETLASRPGSGGHWLLNLACFNLGIEALQLLLVSLAFPLVCFSTRFAWGPLAERTASLSVMMAGLSWLVLRLVGTG